MTPRAQNSPVCARRQEMPANPDVPGRARTVGQPSVSPGHQNRAFWHEEARRRRTDMSSLLRQRIRARAWVNAGRPPIAAWHREFISSEGDCV
jgi:hypothetical protein